MMLVTLTEMTATPALRSTVFMALAYPARCAAVTVCSAKPSLEVRRRAEAKERLVVTVLGETAQKKLPLGQLEHADELGQETDPATQVEHTNAPDDA